MDVPIKKIYYTLSELSHMFGMTPQGVLKRCETYDIRIRRRPYPAKIRVDQLDRLKLIHVMLNVEGLQPWKIKELIG